MGKIGVIFDHMCKKRGKIDDDYIENYLEFKVKT